MMIFGVVVMIGVFGEFVMLMFFDFELLNVCIMLLVVG